MVRYLGFLYIDHLLFNKFVLLVMMVMFVVVFNIVGYLYWMDLGYVGFMDVLLSCNVLLLVVID